MFEEILNTKKHLITEESLINSWLKEYFDTTLYEVKIYYENDDGTLKEDATRSFYEDYAVTKEQHDAWDKGVRQILRKKFRMNKDMFDRKFQFTYLNTAPSIKKQENET